VLLSFHLHRSWQSHSALVGAFAKSYQENHPIRIYCSAIYGKEIEENILKQKEIDEYVPGIICWKNKNC
jgi:hypothetical protein